MGSREEILARVRSALGAAPTEPAPTEPAPTEPAPTEPAKIERGYRTHSDHPDLVGLLVDRLVDYRAEVHRGAGAGIADLVAAALTAAGPAPRVVVPDGLPRSWLPAGVEVVPAGAASVEQLETVDAVLTGATVAVAETGTIVLDAAPDQGRRIITLLPDVHICVLRTDQVVGTVPEAVARLVPTRPQTWISGPSATSDIELDRVEGVHGPRTLHVVIVDPVR